MCGCEYNVSNIRGRNELCVVTIPGPVWTIKTGPGLADLGGGCQRCGGKAGLVTSFAL